jgi:DNA-binding HxlR family transcriptional regulator
MRRAAKVLESPDHQLLTRNQLAFLIRTTILRAMQQNEPPVCASEVIFRVLRGRWALPLLIAIAEHGPIHFLAIGRSVPGISKKVLTDQLRFLQQAGVITRSSAETRQEVFYQLSNRGRELKAAIDGLNDLAARWPDL